MKKGKIAFMIAGIVLAYFITHTISRNSDLANNGKEIMAVVEEYSYVKYVENEESVRHVEFHSVSYKYQYENTIYTGLSELQPFNFLEVFDNKPTVGDSISVIISTKNPEVSKLKGEF